MIVQIVKELKRHAQFTTFGAATGIAIMSIIVFCNIPSKISYTSFYILHPLHVVLSALVTTAMYKLYTHGKLWMVILIGYTGSIGIATLSDAIIPYIGAYLLGIKIPFIIPFMTKWWINPLAFVGIMIGYLRPTTKLPHSGHVLLSTWASLFLITQHQVTIAVWMFPFIFLFLFLAVWIPCCTSDIVYPLLFVKKTK
ncbi:hypothetical protein HQ584_09305 [Patescibacteria group bacterium]|nr:hypothetical protein [Patescibacteria group bacterium]